MSRPSPSLPPEAARAYAHFLKLRRDSPPRFLALYRPNLDDGWSFVAVFDMENGHDALRALAAVARAVDAEPVLVVPAEDPECFTLLDFEAPGLSLPECRRLYRAFERGSNSFVAARRHRRFSPAYHALLRRLHGHEREG